MVAQGAPAAALLNTRVTYGEMFSLYVPIGSGVFIVVVLATLFVILRGRRRPVGEVSGRRESNRLEITYVALLLATAAFLITETLVHEHTTDTALARERPALTVNVIAARWEWQFGYPAYGFSVYSGTVGRQPLVVPAGRPIRFQLHSLDVLHAFWIPSLDFKHDIFPGVTQDITLTVLHPGTRLGECAEFCGLRHAEMIFPVRVLAPDQFAAWARAHTSAARPGGAGRVPVPFNYTNDAPGRLGPRRGLA